MGNGNTMWTPTWEYIAYYVCTCSWETPATWQTQNSLERVKILIQNTFNYILIIIYDSEAQRWQCIVILNCTCTWYYVHLWENSMGQEYSGENIWPPWSLTRGGKIRRMATKAISVHNHQKFQLNCSQESSISITNMGNIHRMQFFSLGLKKLMNFWPILKRQLQNETAQTIRNSLFFFLPSLFSWQKLQYTTWLYKIGERARHMWIM